MSSENKSSVTARRHPFTEEEFFSIYSRVPRVTVEVLLLSEEGVVLLLRKHRSWNNLWHIPGGSLHYGELLPDAAFRVGQEELGVTVEVHDHLGVLQYPSEPKERGFGWSVGVVLLCSTKDSLLSHNIDGEMVQVFKKLPDNLVSEQRNVLEAALERRSWNMLLQYSSTTIKEY